MVSSTRKILLPHFLHLGIFITSITVHSRHPLERRFSSGFRNSGVVFVDVANRLSAYEVSDHYLIAHKLVQVIFVDLFSLFLFSFPVPFGRESRRVIVVHVPHGLAVGFHHGFDFAGIKEDVIGSAVADVAPEEELAVMFQNGCGAVFEIRFEIPFPVFSFLEPVHLSDLLLMTLIFRLLLFNLLVPTHNSSQIFICIFGHLRAPCFLRNTGRGHSDFRNTRQYSCLMGIRNGFFAG